MSGYAALDAFQIGRFSANCSLLFTDVPLLERPSAARAAGFAAVEFWWPFATADPVWQEIDAFVDAIATSGVVLDALNLFGGDLVAGERGIVSHPGRQHEFIASVAVAAEIGTRLGTRKFNALYGHRLPGVEASHQDRLALINLEHAADVLGSIGGQVLLEPLSGTDSYPLTTVAEVTGVLRQLERRGVRNTKLLADLFHLANNGEDVTSLISEHAAGFGHLQVADSPGRGAPGTGRLPLTRWIDQACRAGYAGRIGLEYAGSADGFEWMRNLVSADRTGAEQ